MPGLEQTPKLQATGLMTVALQDLLRLQTLEFDEAPRRNLKSQVAELRNQIPPFILNRYDRLRAHHKKAVAIVLNSTCTSCHMRQPIGKMAALVRGEEIQVCDSCGRYLLLCGPVDGGALEPVAAAHSTARRMGGSQMLR